MLAFKNLEYPDVATVLLQYTFLVKNVKYANLNEL